MTKTRYDLPWPRPISVYDSDGPRHESAMPCYFPVAGIVFCIGTPIGSAPASFRDRYQVVCVTCREVLQNATVDPSEKIHAHLQAVHAFVDDLCYEDDVFDENGVRQP